MKTTGEFSASLSLEEPPQGSTVYEKALWYAGKGDWDRAHNIIQDMTGQPAAQIHGFLHRKEGDFSNARYWYEKSGSCMPTVSLDEEWEELVRKFIN